MANETNVPAKAMVRYKESFRCAHLIGAVDNIAVVSVDMIIVVVDAKKIARVSNYIIYIYIYVIVGLMDGCKKYYLVQFYTPIYSVFLPWFKQNGVATNFCKIYRVNRGGYRPSNPRYRPYSPKLTHFRVLRMRGQPTTIHFLFKKLCFLVERFLQKSRFCMKKIGGDKKKRRIAGKRQFLIRSKRLVAAVADTW
jgi:hypothetical protein